MFDEKPQQESVLESLRQVIREGLDYAASRLQLLSAKITDLALTGVIFVALIILASLFILVGLALLLVALGVWLSHILGSAVLSLLILGGIAFLLALVLGGYALRWLNTLKS